MKILSIHIFSLNQNSPIKLSSAFSLSFISIFQRGTIKEFLNFHSRLIIGRVEEGKFAEVKLEKGICYALSCDKIGLTMICDEEYPKRVAFDILLKIKQNFEEFLKEKKIEVNLYITDTDLKYDFIKNEIEEWQDPSNKDSIMKLQEELYNLNEIMIQNLNELLKRDENLQMLIIKSEELSKTSKNFYINAKKTNRCCNL